MKVFFLISSFTLEPICPSSFPDVFHYPYPGVGKVSPHVARGLPTSSVSTAKARDHIASPLNPYAGMLCAEYKYNFKISEYEATGVKVCQYPKKPSAAMKDLVLISEFANYFICDGVSDCRDGEDEAPEICGELFSLFLLPSNVKIKILY